MDKTIIGNIDKFAIGYNFYDDTRVTELFLYIDGVNVLEFAVGGQVVTTKWNLDDLAFWLRHFIDNMGDDPYPFDVKGLCAAEKDENARSFESDDDAVFDAYYDKIDSWNERHRWHPACNGAILSDVYFMAKDNLVEISWNNVNLYDDIKFTNLTGFSLVDKQTFYLVSDSFLKEYAKHWF